MPTKVKPKKTVTHQVRIIELSELLSRMLRLAWDQPALSIYLGIEEHFESGWVKVRATRDGMGGPVRWEVASNGPLDLSFRLSDEQPGKGKAKRGR